MHHHMHRPPPQMPPHNMPSNIPSSMPGSMPMPPASVPMSMPGPMGMQNVTNQMGQQMQQGHFMGMNPMQSGPPSGGMPPPGGGFSNGMLNMQGPPTTSGPQMYPPAGAFNRPQGRQMPMMPGLGPYQPSNQSGLPPPPLPPGPPPPQTQQ